MSFREMPSPRNIEGHSVVTPLLNSERLKRERLELWAISNRAQRVGRLRFSVLFISPLGGISPPSSNLLWESAWRGRPDPQRRITALPTGSPFLLQGRGRWQRLLPVALNLAAEGGLFARTLNYLETPQQRYFRYLARKDSRCGLFR